MVQVSLIGKPGWETRKRELLFAQSALIGQCWLVLGVSPKSILVQIEIA